MDTIIYTFVRSYKGLGTLTYSSLICLLWLFFFHQVATELNKQEAAYKEVKLTHRKIVEKKEEYAQRAAEVTENQRKLHRYVVVVPPPPSRLVAIALLLMVVVLWLCWAASVAAAFAIVLDVADVDVHLILFDCDRRTSPSPRDACEANKQKCSPNDRWNKRDGENWRNNEQKLCSNVQRLNLKTLGRQ